MRISLFSVILLFCVSGAGIAHAQTDATITLDKTEYPIPFGIPSDFASTVEETPSGRAIFPIHPSGLNGGGLDRNEYVDENELVIFIRIHDPDLDLSQYSQDKINVKTSEGVGPLKVSVIRGSDVVVLGYVGGGEHSKNRIDVGDDSPRSAPQFNFIDEIAPDAGIFEDAFEIKFTDGPASSLCPAHLNGDRFDVPAGSGESYCILNGDVLQVEYTDLSDASGDVSVVTASATFVLKDAVLQTDKSVYIIGEDMILTLIELDLDLNNDYADRYTLDLIGWYSESATLSMGDLGGETIAFDPEPSHLRETGDSTGIFQAVVKVPRELTVDRLERGEEITLEYVDWSPSAASYVGSESNTVTTTINTSNFGATIELDQETYTWTDRIYITIVAPEHNFDRDLIDEIGNSGDDPIKVSTRGFAIDDYKLVETGTDTDIFTGEVILTGFLHDVDGDGQKDGNPRTQGSGPTDGFLQTDDDDGLTVSFEFSEDETVIASALINWNTGVVEWRESSYSPDQTGVAKVVDRDMNLDPKAIDSFGVNVWSDTDDSGIGITVTETDVASGIFEGDVSFTTVGKSSDNTLRITKGDTVTAKYTDYTLPKPNTTLDRLDVTGTMSISGTAVVPDFGVMIELDKSTYSWTEKAVITITSPDHNLDGSSVDEIGSGSNQIQIKTRNASLDGYTLVETGPDTGIFRGNVTLAGFADHDADGDGVVNDASGVTRGQGPTDGMIAAGNVDALTVVFEIADEQVVLGSSLIEWNLATVEWGESSYTTNQTGVARVTDMDMNLNPNAADSFVVDVYSDTDAGGVRITVMETGKETGIFEGAVMFVIGERLSGNILRITEGDTITIDYGDHTPPHPNSELYELDVTATATIASAVDDTPTAPEDLTVTITSDVGNGSSTSSNLLSFVATFGDVVTGFEISDITVSGSAGLNTPAVSNFAESGTTYTFDVGTTSDGTVSVLIPQNAAVNGTIQSNESETYTVTVNTVAPIISSVDAASGTYKEGDTIPITVSFNNSVTVSGTPKLKLETGTRDGIATYASGSPGTSLEFTYVVSDNENTDKLDYVATDSLSLDGGTIHSTDDSSLPAILDLPSTGSSKSLAESDIVIDTAAPTIKSIETSSESAIKVTGSEPLAGDVLVSDFAVSGGADIVISTVSISGSTINITLDGKITGDDKIKFSYLNSSVTDVAGNALNTLDDRTVKNTIAKDSPDTKPDESRPKLPSSSQPETVAETVPETKPESEPPTDSDPKPQTVPETKPESEPPTDSDPKPQTIAEPEPSFAAEPSCGPGTYADNGICKVGIPNIDSDGAPSCGPGTYADNGICKVGIPNIDSDGAPSCGPGTYADNGICKVGIPNIDSDGAPSCGPGTYADNGICKVGIPNIDSDGAPSCGPGTYADNGICKVDDRDDIFSIILSMFENILG